MTYEQETLWLAGLLEGEGSFGHNYGGSRKMGRGMRISLGMTDRDVVEKAAVIMNARVWIHGPRGNRKQFYFICISGERAIATAKRILPFMGQRRKARLEELLQLAAQRLSPRERALKSWRDFPHARRTKVKDTITIPLPLN